MTQSSIGDLLPAAWQVRLLFILGALALAIFAVMLVSSLTLRFRRPSNQGRGGRRRWVAEASFGLIPLLIVGGAVAPSARLIWRASEAPGTALTIRVIGMRHHWQYEYLSLGDRVILRTEREPLVVPSGVAVRLQLTATDAAYAWWSPSLGILRSAVPGFVNEVTLRVEPGKQGMYRAESPAAGVAADARMPVDVEVMAAGTFAAWLKQRTASEATADGAAPSAARALTRVSRMVPFGDVQRFP